MVEGPLKRKYLDRFEKSAKLRRANLSGVRRTHLRRSDFEMQRNAEIGFFAELSWLASYSRPGGGMQNKTRKPRDGRP
jgi:hypothetical protein